MEENNLTQMMVASRKKRDGEHRRNISIQINDQTEGNSSANENEIDTNYDKGDVNQMQTDRKRKWRKRKVKATKTKATNGKKKSPKHSK